MKDKFNLKERFDVGKTSWLGIGGVCEYFFRPKSHSELVDFLKINDKKLTILGNTSNVIIKDDFIDGVTIRLAGNFCNIKKINDDLIEVGSGMLDKNFALIMMDEGIGGFEFLSTIPGNIGGGIKMNCGCYGGEIAERFVSLNGLTFKGEKVVLNNKDITFEYRGSSIPDDLIITSVVLRGIKSSKEKILSLITENQKKRSESQPTSGKTLGSTFKNLASMKAWELLDKAGLRGIKIGGASFSEKHLNFLINDGSATYNDVISLINLAQRLVYEKYSIKLELEVRHIL